MPPTTELGRLFVKYGSDKDKHGYSPHYESILAGIRTSPIEILEVGIGTMIPGAASSMVGYSLSGYRPGGSLRAWRDYFPNAQVTGIDIQPDTQFAGEERISTLLADSTNASSLQNALGERTFDVIVDDGLHEDTNQLSTLINLWPRVRSGGYYVIEDISFTNRFRTSYRPLLSILEGRKEIFYYEFPGNQDIVFISKS